MPRVRVKICGVTTPDDVRVVIDEGADAVGLNFYPRSPRYVSIEAAERLLAELPPYVSASGVFVGTPVREMCDLSQRLGLHAVQCFAEPEHFESAFVVRRVVAFRVKDHTSLDEIDQYLARCKIKSSMPAAVLVDAHADGQLGGTGRTAPWEILRGFRPGVPLILAGGLTPENVADAIRTVRPFAVDVASGVESAPGRKDPDKVRRFIENARLASSRV
jgi:phosphoribosylanthranilate isomerase